MKRAWFCLWLLMATVVGFAGVNEWGFNFQSELRDAKGNVYLDDRGRPARRQTIEIRLYDTETEGSALWGRRYVVFCDYTGYFNVFVTDAQGTALVSDATLESIFKTRVGGGLYVGVTRVGLNESEMQPRPRLCAVPTACVAGEARSLAGATSAIQGALQVEGKVSSAKVTVVGDANVTNVTFGGKLLQNGKEMLEVPVNGIILWYNASGKAPDGKDWSSGKSQDGRWEIVGNFEDRFPLGAGGSYTTLKATGGEKNVTLTADQIPRHTHKMIWDDTYNIAALSMRWRYMPYIDGIGGYGETATDKFLGFWYASWKAWEPDYGVVTDSSGNCLEWWLDGTHYDSWLIPQFEEEPDDENNSAREAYTDQQGWGGAHNNMPPWYRVTYIRRIK